MPDWLNSAAALAGIAGISISGLAVFGFRWLRANSIVVDLQNPLKEVVKRRLSRLDVWQGLEILLEDARAFQPHAIFGINRGGALVGGYLAKKLGLPVVHLLTVNCDHAGPGRVLDPRAEMQKPPGERLLLVDDAVRKGEHMREAERYLRETHPESTLRRQVLLQLRVPHPGPEEMVFRGTPVEKSAFFTNDSRVLLPWDP